jgi:ParB family chromosome partitioning protein
MKHDLMQQVKERTGTMDMRAVGVTVKDIPIGHIVTRKNMRKSDDVNIAALKENIKAHGLLHPITVYKDGEEYVVIMGHRRLLAVRALHKEEPDRFHSIRCTVTDNKKITQLQVSENRHREKVDQVELYNSFKDMKGQGLSYKQISEHANMSEGTVKNIFAGIAEIDADPENMDILQKSHDVTLTDFQTVKPIKDKVVKKKLLTAKADKKITQKELQNKVKMHVSKGKPARSVGLDVQKLSIKLKFKENDTCRKIAADIKSALKRHNIAIKGV